MLEVLIAIAIISAFSLSMSTFLASYRRSEHEGRISSSVDRYIKDRIVLLQTNSVLIPVSESTYQIPSTYVGDTVVTVTETPSTTSVPTGYDGMRIINLNANWVTEVGVNATRSHNFIVYKP